MKTIIVTSIAIIASLFISSTNVFASTNNQDGLYKTETMDEDTKTLTVTTCKGENGSNLTFHKKHTIQYNEAGSPVEKIQYSWNGFDWEATQKYNYEYDATGQLSIMTLKYWDKSKKVWSDKKTSQVTYTDNNAPMLTHK